MPGPTALPERVGRYRIVGELAVGGMATVYLGIADGEVGSRSADSGVRPRLWAIKRVHPHLARDGEFVEMFRDEIRIATRIKHPNVCTVVEWGESDGTLFLAMELLKGETLISALRKVKKEPALLEHPWWPLFAARVVAHACAGLHAAHELVDEIGKKLNVVHRDVTPHNVFVTWDGSAKIVDFGVAHAEHRIHETRAGTVKGKFAYMSPEQLKGADVARTMDVWALGVVLWEMLAGRPLFRRRQDAETIFAVANAKVPPLANIRPGVPAELEAIARRALDPDPWQRTPTAEAMQRQLEEWIEAEGGFDVQDTAAMLAMLFPGQRDLNDRRIEAALAGAAPLEELEDEEIEITPVGALPQRRRGRTLALLGLLVATTGAAVAGLAYTGRLPISVPSFASEPEESAAPSIASEPTPVPVVDEAPTLAPPVQPEAGPALARAPRTARTAPRAEAEEAPIAAAVEEAPADPGEAEVAPAAVDTAEPAASEAGAPATEGAPGTAAGAEPVAEGEAEAADESGAHRSRIDRAALRPDSGDLQVTVVGGGAGVYLGDLYLGHAPGRFAVPDGMQTITIRPDAGGPDRSARVRMRAGHLSRLRVVLDQ
jgi:serine/threonine-protein kinase